MVAEKHMDYTHHRRNGLLAFSFSCCRASKAEGSVHAHIEVIYCIDSQSSQG